MIVYSSQEGGTIVPVSRHLKNTRPIAIRLYPRAENKVILVPGKMCLVTKGLKSVWGSDKHRHLASYIVRIPVFVHPALLPTLFSSDQ